jgi:hypothetical protein
MIFELLVKCVVLITVIHGLRAVCRRIGPRVSGLILGLPSSTAMVLFLCGRERGGTGAAEMAEASLLGLVAAVALPSAYAQAVRRGWRLPGALAASIAAYFLVAIGLGSVDPGGPVACLGISLGAIGLTSILAARLELPGDSAGRLTRSSRWSPLVRTAVPAVYALGVGIAGGMASPRWAGLVSTFPSMSTVLLTVTHLEEGPVQASRIARALPSANLSTAVFLAAFRFTCPLLGPAWATLLGYAAALTNLAVMELAIAPRGLGRFYGAKSWPPDQRPAPRRPQPTRAGIRSHVRSVRQSLRRHRPAGRRRFAPRLEALPC